MIRDIFGATEPKPDNSYYTMRSLESIVPNLADPDAARQRLADIRAAYAELSAIYQAGEKTMALS
ncbi:MAG: hypothetical protein LIP18_04990 [Planctomycetes bacterium]|nr:hypothetical protein [Planctomycetota bacterium]